MFENKGSLLISAAILLGFIILATVVGFSANKIGFKVAVVDANRIIQESQLGKTINEELSKKGSELSGKIKSAKTDEEKAQFEQEFERIKNEKEADFTKRVKAAIAKLSKAKNVKVVVNPQIVLHSELDLTDEVIAELDK